MTTDDRRYRINAPDVIDESVDGEVLIVHLGTGAYYSADGLGEVVWRQLIAGHSPLAVAAAVGERTNGAAVGESFDAFVSGLIGDGLLVPDPSVSAPPAVELPAPLPLTGLVLNKYTDMEALLLLDPVHEVDPGGWPLMKVDPAQAEGETAPR